MESARFPFCVQEVAQPAAGSSNRSWYKKHARLFALCSNHFRAETTEEWNGRLEGPPLAKKLRHAKIHDGIICTTKGNFVKKGLMMGSRSECSSRACGNRQKIVRRDRPDRI
jgi:hypothetical protein